MTKAIAVLVDAQRTDDNHAKNLNKVVPCMHAILSY